MDYFNSLVLFVYDISLSLGVVIVSLFIFLDFFNNILILVNIDLLILLYPRFNIDKFYSNMLSWLYLIFFIKFEPVLRPNEFCSKCNSFNFNIVNVYLLYLSLQFANKQACSSPIFRLFNFNICIFDDFINGIIYFSIKDCDIKLLDKFKYVILLLHKRYFSNKICETNSYVIPVFSRFKDVKPPLLFTSYSK